jgi:hypothetical protein
MHWSPSPYGRWPYFPGPDALIQAFRAREHIGICDSPAHSDWNHNHNHTTQAPSRTDRLATSSSKLTHPLSSTAHKLSRWRRRNVSSSYLPCC